jgi:hypothetical protein
MRLFRRQPKFDVHCIRKIHSEAGARAAAEKSGKGYFRCAWCRNWHTGDDPGPVEPCWRCGTLVTIPRDGSTPRDAARGWFHAGQKCNAA